jgi:hypothetical protein
MPKVRVNAPLTPCAVKLNVPVAASAAAETVRLDVALPFAGGVTEAGLKVHVDPAGRPVQPRSTAELKPLVEVTVQVLAPLVCPWVTVRLAGLHDTLKLGTGAGLTVSAMLADRVSAPLVPWAWIVKFPVAAPPEAAMVSVLPAVGVTDAGK